MSATRTAVISQRISIPCDSSNMRMEKKMKLAAFLIASVLLFASASLAQNPFDCSKVPDRAKLKAALTNVVKQGQASNGGLGNQEWAAVVNRDGIVCAVVFSGPSRAAEWPGSRLIAGSKANTANDFALSTGNIYAAAQPGGSLFGINAPPNPNVAYAGDPSKFGQADDPMVG